MFKNVHCVWKAEGCMTAAEDPQGTLLMMVVVAPPPPPRRLYTEEEGKGTYQNLSNIEVSLQRNYALAIELVSKELNHLAAILHVYAGGLNFI